MTLNRTHDPSRNSWLASAHGSGCDFPLQNLPYGVFRTATQPEPRIGVALGHSIVDLAALAQLGLLPSTAKMAVEADTLNPLLALGQPVWSDLRDRLSELLGEDTCPPGALRQQVESCLRPMAAATLLLPAAIGGYTDFYASIHHATNVGALFRPDQPLLPNYKWVPIGYHGRTSSIVASPTSVRRPAGQQQLPGAAAPTYGPCRQLDYELELGAIVGPGNPLGAPVPIGEAADHLFGLVLLNDWSARDIQAWEYQPLGPFLGKNFATTLSPWVVTMEALAPFRVPARVRPAEDPSPLPYLTDTADQDQGALDLTLEVWLLTAAMRSAGLQPELLTAGNFKETYWTWAQLLTHHTSNGCNLQPGDLLGSGTVSGPSADSRGCLLELTARGAHPRRLRNGEERRFLEDGDEVHFRAHAEVPGARRIGFGECRGLVLPAAG